MNVTCLIDSLGSGGAQRQLSMLAVLLKRRGLQSRVLFFRTTDFYLPFLHDNGVPVELAPGRSKALRAARVLKALRTHRPDVVISFMHPANLLAEVSSLLGGGHATIVSERGGPIGRAGPSNRMRLQCHRLARAVVTNAPHVAEAIVRSAPYLRTRVKVILNCVDLDLFVPTTGNPRTSWNPVNLLVLARFTPEKNPLVMVSAFDILRREHPQLDVAIDWYGNAFFVDGRPSRFSSTFLRTEQAIKQFELGDGFRLHPAARNVLPLYQNSSAVVLPSLYEGLPNVICEAMSCGRPVLASDVGSIRGLVQDGRNGFLFDPRSPKSIADCILSFCQMAPKCRERMGREGRALAEDILSPLRFADEYSELISSVYRSS